ncbi:MAG: ABC transporter permease [Defluviitaleaceae bacterium]|nr:ABC transporter permease [Defluviitaleaceae bacterium]
MVTTQKNTRNGLVSQIKLRIETYNFLFVELVKRDFKKKYKRTSLGILWSLLSPLLHLLVMMLVFTQFFGRDTPHFLIHVFSGLKVFQYFTESTNGGMSSLVSNAGIISKIRAPKYLFLLSKNVSSFVSFILTMCIFFIFVAIDGIPFSPRFFLLIYPVITLTLFNIGVGLILSAMFVFFKDIQYLYEIFTRLVMFMSAIFWPVESLSPRMQQLFLLNPIFTHIHYFRLVVIHGLTPSINVHLIMLIYPTVALLLGGYVYKKYSDRFIYHM